jgi:hypothetical protein
MRQARLREEAAQAAVLAAEATRLVAAQALAEAREQEHMMVLHVAIALKTDQDKEPLK